MSYNGWRDVTVIWNDGTKEVINALGRPEPYVTKDGILRLRVSDDGLFRNIPLTAIREWSMREYR